MNTPIAIIMGSDSDLPVMHEAEKVLQDFGVAYDISVVSAHRTPEVLFSFSREAKEKGYKVIIAGAGGAAHLPGMVASLTPLPVVGVPVKSKSMDGLDSLLSIAQMPPGVPVASVAVNGGKNAGLLALQILATSDETLSQKIADYKKTMETEVIDKAKKLEDMKGEDYLKLMQQ